MIRKIVSFFRLIINKNLFYKFTYTCLLISIISSCTRTVQLEKDEYRLNNFEFKGNKEISTEELELLIPFFFNALIRYIKSSPI
jgi:hypothetical protein